MKILYGVQGTGNGHISRARAMAGALAQRNVQVDYLFSGRDPSAYFGMAPFGEYRVREGLTFVNENGRLNYLKTVTRNRYGRFLRDVLQLDVCRYDLVLSDFEPISAWAGQLRGCRVLSLGHQAAFDFSVPVAGRDLRSTLVMRLFAPGDVRIGMHWSHFGAPILPPLIDLRRPPAPQRAGKILVYLPFEPQPPLLALLAGFGDFRFHVYAPGLPVEDRGNLCLRPPSLEGFRADLLDCEGVVCNAGFELTSECLALGKRLLVKPQGRQMEQASNALALRQLGYASTTDQLGAQVLGRWLHGNSAPVRLRIPDVAAALSDWLLAGDFSRPALYALSESLWRQVMISGAPAPALPARGTGGALPA